MASDVYVLRNAVVNKLLDKRLNKFFKFTRGPLQSQNGLDDTLFQGNLVDNEDLLQTCVDLQNAVTILQQTVKDLTNNVTALNQQIEVHDHHVQQVVVTGNLLGRGTANHCQSTLLNNLFNLTILTDPEDVLTKLIVLFFQDCQEYYKKSFKAHISNYRDSQTDLGVFMLSVRYCN